MKEGLIRETLGIFKGKFDKENLGCLYASMV